MSPRSRTMFTPELDGGNLIDFQAAADARAAARRWPVLAARTRAPIADVEVIAMVEAAPSPPPVVVPRAPTGRSALDAVRARLGSRDFTASNSIETQQEAGASPEAA